MQHLKQTTHGTAQDVTVLVMVSLSVVMVAVMAMRHTTHVLRTVYLQVSVQMDRSLTVMVQVSAGQSHGSVMALEIVMTSSMALI